MRLSVFVPGHHEEIDFDTDEIVTALVEQIREQPAMAAAHVNRLATILNRVTDEQIEWLTEEQLKIVHDYLLKQTARFAPREARP